MSNVRLDHPVLRAMIQHAVEQPQQEVCGLLAGDGIQIQSTIPIPNASPTPATAYDMHPNAMLSVLKQLDRDHLTLMGVYHSHPHSPAIPSDADIQAALVHTPDLLHVIISLQATRPRAQAWRIAAGRVSPVELAIGKPTEPDTPFTIAQRVAMVVAMSTAILLLLIIALALLPPAPIITTT